MISNSTFTKRPTNVHYSLFLFLKTVINISFNLLLVITRQGRIQDLSEGGQDFLGTKKFIIRNQKSRRRRNFFDLKDSKRVKIND